MSATSTAFVGAIPENYHAGLGPLLFEPYAEELARRLASSGPARVLETACGTGLLTRRLAARRPEGGRLVATDLNAPMLAVAKRTLGDAAEAVELRTADMTALPFDDGAFDAVVCQFGLMFVPDKAVAAREARRVLRKGGTWMVATWSPLATNEVAQIAHETVLTFFDRDPPKFFDIPYGYGDPDVLRELLAGAGFVDVAVEAVPKVSEAATAKGAALGLVEGNPLSGYIRERAP